MGKRSEFTRLSKDKYKTPIAGVLPLIPFLSPGAKFAEPCCGDCRLALHLQKHGQVCIHVSDIEPEGCGEVMDARDLGPIDGLDYIITNPPWSRPILHDLIRYLPTVAPTWLLFDADWMHTVQASELIKTCSKIVSIGRLKWIENSPHTGKDNCCWYLFPGEWKDGPQFYGRMKM